MKKKVNILEIPTEIITYVDGGDTHNHTRLFEDVLDYVAKQTCPEINGIISDFFQINPENVSAENYVTGATNRYTKMTIAALSDFLSPTAPNPATITTAIFKDLMDDLNTLFNVFWFIDANNNVRIEHELFFNRNAGLDLTVAKYKRFMDGSRAYTYQKNKIPRREEWISRKGYYDTTIGVNDATYAINYALNCSSDEFSEDVVSHTTKTIYTSRAVSYATMTDDSLNALFLFANLIVGGNRYVIGSNGITIHPVTFTELLFKRLILQFHRFGRPQKELATIEFADEFAELDDQEGTPCTFNNPMQVDWDSSKYLLWIQKIKKLKLQKEFTIPLCCEDEFDINELIKTQFGDGDAFTAEFNPSTETIKLQVVHGAEDEEDFEPEQLSGLQLYLNADFGVTEAGGFVTNWADKRANGLEAVAVGGWGMPTKVTDAITGKEAILFDGDGNADGLKVLAFPSFQNGVGTIVIIYHYFEDTDAGNDNVLVGTYGDGTGDIWDMTIMVDTTFPSEDRALMSIVETPFPLVSDCGYGQKLFNAAWIALNPLPKALYYAENWKIHIFSRNGVAVKSRAQGLLKSTGAFAAINPPASNDLNIGNSFQFAGVQSYNGSIASILIFDRVLTDIEAQKIELWAERYYKINLYHDL